MATPSKQESKERFLKINYIARIKDGKIFDTTYEDIAKKEGIYSKEKIYAPLPVIVGEHRVIRGLEEALEDMKVNEEREVEIPPEKGFGKRDPNLVRLVPLSVFKRNNINPIPGMKVTLDGMPARIQTVSGGRVRVDFNHELAGKTLIYKVKVEEEFKSKEEKLRFLIDRNFPMNGKDIKLRIKEKKVEIELPEKVYKDRNLLLRKASLSGDVFKYLNFEEIIFLERWKK
ncbi:MAG TPA: peptidylprolyl isomerase [Candidatus Altiarchaeales archaeon]|nr:peptidylprolyl isomerase [Candidatus Altiarchaeales archaeon]